jgi:phosphoglycerate-specific signal transduction histidine kinase
MPASTTYQQVQGIIDNNGNGWKVQVINQLFTPQEAQKILQIPIIDKSQEDILLGMGLQMRTVLLKQAIRPS